jgi:hypothetical protein
MDSDFSQRSHPGGHTAKPATSGAPLVNQVIDADHPLAGHAANETHSGRPPKKHKWWPPRMPKTRKEWVMAAITIIVAAGVGFAVYAIWFSNKTTPPTKAAKQITAPKPVEPPKKLYSGMMGLEISDSSINDRPITGIMIENSPDARPQSGVDQASIVFEAVAEGGITRFLTLFQENEPTYIGPVRSVRPYYVQWLLGFDAAVAHVGGSGDALRLIKETGAKDLDQFANPAPYHRISSRYAPHNVYTGIPALRDLEAKKGYGKSAYTSLVRKETGAVSPSPNATNIDLTLSGPLYNAHFDYDASMNAYKRSEGGKPHMVVAEDGKQTQLAPKVVVALVMPKGNNGIYSTYQTIGDGPATIFQGGMAVGATWHKSGNKVQFSFTDSEGKEVKLDPGQTWFTAVGSTGSVTYK